MMVEIMIRQHPTQAQTLLASEKPAIHPGRAANPVRAIHATSSAIL